MEKKEQKLRDALASCARITAAAAGDAAFMAAFVDENGTLAYLGPAVGWRARLHGISSTCTASEAGAVRNWCNNVRHRQALKAGL